MFTDDTIGVSSKGWLEVLGKCITWGFADGGEAQLLQWLGCIMQHKDVRNNLICFIKIVRINAPSLSLGFVDQLTAFERGHGVPCIEITHLDCIRSISSS